MAVKIPSKDKLFNDSKKFHIDDIFQRLYANQSLEFKECFKQEWVLLLNRLNGRLKR